ncbi:hypothetical protein CBR_g37379 [Chara braunii]|uniref:Uncharacterized protein n=1 Tax=Chara braunii TaxID=69332 RepID=A0A388K019_CHABU|nr:hypothetical protein CBR_g37379 [Chara braunii]|eukprot:GBG63293.1 hypothetical protein CBR_g37379 [Chara braunii]
MVTEEGIDDQQSGGNQGTNGDGERNERSARDRESAKLEGTREDRKDASIAESSGKVGGSKRGSHKNREGGNDMRTSPRNSAGATPKKTEVLNTRRKLAEIEKRTVKFKARLIEQMMAGDEEDPQDAGSREGRRIGQDDARYEGKHNSHKGTPNKKGKDKDGTLKTGEEQRESKEGEGTSAVGEGGSSEGGLKKIVTTLTRALNKNQGYLADAKKKLTFDGANITEFQIDYENLAALLKWTEEEKMEHLGQNVSLGLGRDIMVIVASSGSWKETRNEMMRKYLKAEKMATEAELAAVHRKNYATYNDFLRIFTLVALRIPGVTDRIMSKYFLRQFSEFDKDKIPSAYRQTSKVNITTRRAGAEKKLIQDTVMEELAGTSTGQQETEVGEQEKVYGKLREDEPVDKATAAKKKFRYRIPILTSPEIDGTLSKLLGTMVSVSFQTMLQASPRLLKGLRQLLTRKRVEVEEAPELQEQDMEEAEAPQGVSNLQSIPGGLRDLEKAFADIRLSLQDREGGEVMRAPPGTKLNFHALPVGKLKVQIGTHHTDALVDGEAEITLIRRDFATVTECTVNKEVAGSIRGAGGKIPFTGYVTKCAVKAGIRESIWSFQRMTAMEEMNHDIILGRPWCTNVEMIGMHLHDDTYMVDIEDPVTGRGELRLLGTGGDPPKGKLTTWSPTFEESARKGAFARMEDMMERV